MTKSQMRIAKGARRKGPFASIDQAIEAIQTGRMIVVVDDDPQVRDVTSAMLSAHGYTVLTAVDGAQALGLIAARVLEVRLVITDLEMPNLDGAALSRVLGSLNPAIRILLVSAAEPSDPRCCPPPSGAFLPKPFNGETLLRSVHSLLDNELTEAG
jgi:CheY-like chemotaxis protein